jgi:hypothetical protein
MTEVRWKLKLKFIYYNRQLLYFSFLTITVQSITMHIELNMHTEDRLIKVFEVFKAMWLSILFLWDLMLHHWVITSRHFKRM